MDAQSIVAILTQKSLDHKGGGSEFLRLLCRTFPEAIPERLGNFEPLQEGLDLENLDEVEKHWNHPFLWENYSNLFEGSVWMDGDQAKNIRHNAIYVSSPSNSLCQNSMIEFLLQMSLQYETDISYVHLLNPQEFTSNYDTASAIRLGLTTQRIRLNLPNLAWGTIFGAPYIEMFGRDRLLSAPASIVKEVGDNLIYVQITKCMRDVLSDYNVFDRIRFQIKNHLNPKAFHDPLAPPGFVYDTPNFSS